MLFYDFYLLNCTQNNIIAIGVIFVLNRNSDKRAEIKLLSQMFVRRQINEVM